MIAAAVRLDERRQFRALYRNFLARVVDLELLSASGEIRNLLAQIASLLAAYSFVVALLLVSNFAVFSGDRAKLALSAWGVEEFLFSTTLTVSGLFAVLAWNNLLPDRRDGFVLTPLPLKERTIFAARSAAIASALGISIGAVNAFTGISLPLFIGGVRCLLAYWLTVAAAGALMFVFIFALQNAACACLHYRLFQRVSGLLQLLAFFAILALFFLTPSLATPARIAAPENRHLLLWLPSYWFLALFQELNGTEYGAFLPLARRAIWALIIAGLFTLSTAALTYGRSMRRMIEQPDIAPGQRPRALSKLVSALAARLFLDPIDRSILLFSVRTLARSRRHRLMLAVYMGLAFAISLAYAKSFVLGTSRQAWDRPNVPLLIASLVMLFFAIIGSRAVAALPFALAANWIFRITAVRTPASYFAAVRKALFSLAALPVLVCAAIVYLSIWPGRPALQHLIVLGLLSSLLVELSLRRFRKIPFACSYLPGKANLRLKLGIAGFLFLFAVDVGANLELWSMQKAARYLTIVALLVVGAIWAKRRTAEFAGSPENKIQFEDAAAAEIYALDLRRDADYVNESDYLDAVSSAPARSFAARVTPYAFGVVMLALAGFCYERFGEWLDAKKFPQVGRSVNIGGRSLNIYCAGSGGTTVVLDSGAGWPGYGWSAVEPGIAKLTRACWYDRAGYGWSDAAPRPRTAADVAGDLHKLLHNARIPAPYVLVGHSLGGFHVRVFADRYRQDVAGLVLVDSADEYEDRIRLPKSLQSPATRYIPRFLFPAISKIVSFGWHFGLARLLDNGVADTEGRLSVQETAIVHTLMLQPKAFDASTNEGLARAETLKQVRAIKSLGNIPLIVLSGAKKPSLDADDEYQNELLDRFMDYRVHVTQAHLAELSTRGKQIVLPDVGHGIPTEAPQAIVDAVGEALRER